jgi:Tol biopolymer transport system component
MTGENMKSVFKILGFICISIIIPVINSCSNINDPIEWDKKNLVAFSAIYNTDSGYEGRIVIADYNNPTNYKIISPSGLEAIDPVFSYTKEKILFGLDGIMAHGNQFAVYDINTGEMEKLYANNVAGKPPLAGKNPVWDFDDKGFYFTQNHTYSIAKGIYYYDLTTKEVTGLYNPQDASVYVVGLKSRDILIVFSNKYFLASRDTNCFFFMSKSGEYISQIRNPNLVLININGVNEKAAYFTNWNYKNKQVLYSASDISQKGYAISITDIEGTYNKQYTSSYYDTRPVWGPDNSIIFFNRQIDSNQPAQLYYVDTVTGVVRQFIDPNIINGADQIMDAAY